MQKLLQYIENLNFPGAVLIFLPGWNIIYMLAKFIQSQLSPAQEDKYRIYALHSQMPKDEQRKVFDFVPLGVRKVSILTIFL